MRIASASRPYESPGPRPVAPGLGAQPEVALDKERRFDVEAVVEPCTGSGRRGWT